MWCHSGSSYCIVESCLTHSGHSAYDTDGVMCSVCINLVNGTHGAVGCSSYIVILYRVLEMVT